MKLTLVGVNFRPREAKDIVTELEPGDTVRLRREPSNAYDPNAIQVLANNADLTHIGYVAKEEAVLLAPELDEIIALNDEDAQSATVFPAVVYAKTGAWKAILSYDE